MRTLYNKTKQSTIILLSIFCTFYSIKSTAQCTSFFNADSANPILNATPAPQNINGLQFVDIDGDGDLDCYLVSGNSLLLYRNEGTAKHPRYVLCPNNGFQNSSTLKLNNVFAFADLDGDGDLDFVTQSSVPRQGHGGSVFFLQYYENTGTKQNPVFTARDYNPVGFADDDPFGGYLYISFQDINGDGKPDFYYSEQTFEDQRSYIYLNTSTTAVPSFTYYTIIGSPFLYPYRYFYDFNKDGLPDAVNNNGGNGYIYQPNEGTLALPQYQFFYYGPGPTFAFAPYVITDLNDDGAPEIFNINGHYASVAPVPVIKKSTFSFFGLSFTMLSPTTKSNAYTYSWEYNGKAIRGYHEPFVFALRKGTYTLFIKDSCGTGISLPYITTENGLLASSNEMTAEEIHAVTNPATGIKAGAYPNPFNSSILVQLPTGAMAITKSTIQITDLAGRIMSTQTTAATSVKVGDNLPAGIYLLQVFLNDKIVYHSTIIKQ